MTLIFWMKYVDDFAFRIMNWGAGLAKNGIVKTQRRRQKWSEQKNRSENEEIITKHNWICTGLMVWLPKAIGKLNLFAFIIICIILCLLLI